ncbi:MAG: FtsX-like permease family protein [Clostridiaceae bacterium]|nr:FtsX-like permease family protein [Clostridiaceae bacterium]
MKLSEILRLVFINLVQNKFKVILTSIGIVVGAATIVMVIAIGRGGQMDVADQFKNLNAGAIDISYAMNNGMNTQNPNSASGNSQSGGFAIPGGMGGSDSGFMPQKSNGSSSSSGNASGSGSNASNSGNASGSGSTNNAPGSMPQDNAMDRFIFGGGNSNADSRVNFERITLSEEDVEDLEVFVPGLAQASISYTTRAAVDGGDLEEETTYTIAGVKSDYAGMSNLNVAIGDFITDGNEENAEKICVLGASIAEEIFGSATEAYDSLIYIDSRPYVVNGVLQTMGDISSGISPDEAIFIPYSTGVKYIAGTSVSPTITVIAADVNGVASVISNIKQTLAESYPNAEFTISDAGSKMAAASASNNTLTLLLFAMAAIVFIVGGIGIMNVLFVSVKERTKEIGILKSIGCRKRDILLEFLFEACFISILGGILGVAVSILITPIIELLSVRVELSVIGAVLAVCFAIVTGTAFGFYPAIKASKLIPVQALSDI